MKFGVLQFFSWPGRRVPLPVVYERALERIEVMDRSGYDAVWLAEHHFNDFSVCPSVHMMATHVAARTTRLRIGTAVSLAAFYHPLRLAEEVALLDVLSGGRVNWGAGRGFDRKEFESFGVAPEESYARFRESVDVVLRAWREPRLSYEGEFYRFEDVEVLPKPLQEPHPPTWMGVTSGEAIRWAAAEGHSILLDPHCTHAELVEKQVLYRECLEAAGHVYAGRELPAARLLAVDRSDAKAREVAERGATWMVKSYVDAARRNVGGSLSVSDPTRTRNSVERYLDDVIVYGSPERVRDQLDELRDDGALDYLLCAPLSHDTFLHMTDDVLPHLVS